MLIIFNTLTGKKEEFIPLQDNKVRMYVCGVTVYDYCHIGHARSSVVFDIIRRYLIYKEYDVTFVKNFTDIDDKIIKRSNEENIHWKELTEKFIKEHDYDMEKLNIMPPDFTPKATEFIDEMIKLCEKLIEKGYAYVVDGDVYYRVEKFKDYGKLSKRNLDELLAGARVEVDERKENPLDFALWKKSKENEPYWESPWGKGRPGWHIECSVMSAKLLGIPFDIHGGGKDLIFPHHENEIAQSEAAEEKMFAKYWIHNGFVNINKEKMSKSLGNFFTIREIIKEFDPEVLRFFLLTTHYRSPIDFSFDHLVEAEQSLNRIYTFLDDLEHYVVSKKGKNYLEEANKIFENFKKEFETSMDDDFNSAKALAAIFDYIKEINRLLNQKVVKETYEEILKLTNNFKKIVNQVLGIINKTPKEWFASNLPISESELIKKIEERTNARKNKNFELADKIRDELESLGIELLDTPTGTRYRAIKKHEGLK
ncbi:cysteinyl-tRNA synthetase [Deferribacter desulfuricans SSM1]|uniref:Cysteine--tRNA ligase n=1 Tax=Deferribacter desulfuricans (strain DSM 14783 / JCM 11476 / NBRC 101012 / SSM1) TaxID=639282 RepID=D3PCJ1_DEFDS|nr:cysteine--tRNA ligase [Deferribacter desulfuricans]BAI80314.1 cysteinyl-tRNA synthetase [Deferribacter desulfuricans SSM1]